MDNWRTYGWCAAAMIAAAGVYVSAQSPSTGRAAEMDAVAQSYVKLVLAVGQHDADYVDAYYGPPEWKKESEAKKHTLDEISMEASSLRTTISTLPPGNTEMEQLRREYLDRQLSSLLARVRML
jgi:hypothetical protein